VCVCVCVCVYVCVSRSLIMSLRAVYTDSVLVFTLTD